MIKERLNIEESEDLSAKKDLEKNLDKESLYRNDQQSDDLLDSKSESLVCNSSRWSCDRLDIGEIESHQSVNDNLPDDFDVKRRESDETRWVE